MKRPILRYFFTKILLLLFASNSFSQSKTERTYTNEAIDNKMQGRVIIEFVINAKGNILKDSVKVVRGLGYGLDEIAIDAIQKAPKWYAPAKAQLDSNGHTKFAIPVGFDLTKIPDKEWIDYYNWKGNNLLAKNDYENARLMFEKGLEKKSNNPVALYGLSEVYKGKGDNTSAETYLNKAIKKGYKKD